MTYNALAFTLPESDSIDLAAIDAFDPTAYLEQGIPTAMWEVNHYRMNWLASKDEVDSVLPGDDVYIAGYPGLGDRFESRDRPVHLDPQGVGSNPSIRARAKSSVSEARQSTGRVLCAHSFSFAAMFGTSSIPSATSTIRETTSPSSTITT